MIQESMVCRNNSSPELASAQNHRKTKTKERNHLNDAEEEDQVRDREIKHRSVAKFTRIWARKRN